MPDMLYPPFENSLSLESSLTTKILFTHNDYFWDLVKAIDQDSDTEWQFIRFNTEGQYWEFHLYAKSSVQEAGPSGEDSEE
jgi:hypothetical protein